MNPGPPTLPSDRSFGLLFTAVSAALAGYVYWKGASPAYPMALAVTAAVLATCTIARPAVLRPLNRAWAMLGLILGRIVSPIVIGLLFFLIVTPTAVVGRLAGRDPLRLKFNDDSSYWLARKARDAEPGWFRRQF
ncbi:MAG: SxtJ family membrane protein [Hyphomicrobiaceae bacterium]